MLPPGHARTLNRFPFARDPAVAETPEKIEALISLIIPL
jgi:hypothetical protein